MLQLHYLFTAVVGDTINKIDNLQISADNDKIILEDTFIAFARVFSGTLKKGIFN